MECLPEYNCYGYALLLDNFPHTGLGVQLKNAVYQELMRCRVTYILIRPSPSHNPSSTSTTAMLAQTLVVPPWPPLAIINWILAMQQMDNTTGKLG